jgi:hypothetical protein
MVTTTAAITDPVIHNVARMTTAIKAKATTSFQSDNGFPELSFWPSRLTVMRDLSE